MFGKFILRKIFISLVFVCATASASFAQTTEFTYQGNLSDTGTPAANYDFEFRLFDVETGGAALTSQQKSSVAVSGGAFTVRLDFGATNFDGSSRWLEIAVKRPSEGTYTTLTPRQPINSAPYSIRSLTAGVADNAAQLGGVDASEYVTTATVGSTFINNDSVPQTADFNISGSGLVGTQLGVGKTAEPGIRIDSLGTIRSYDTNSTSIITQTDGGDNAWARFYAITPSQRWFFGTSRNFNGNQFYLVDDTSGQTRMAIQPNGGAITFPFGAVGIGGTPQTGIKFDVTGNSVFRTANGSVNFGSPNSETGMSVISTNRADFRFDGTTLKILAGTGLGPPSNTSGIAVNTLGSVGIGTSSPSGGLEINRDWDNQFGTLTLRGGQPTIRFSGTTSGNQNWLIHQPAAGHGNLEFYSSLTPGNWGSPKVSFGTDGTTQMRVLQITGGSDLAEVFEFAEPVKPGLVVAIDPRNAGKLTLARGAYNRRVAGIISGANNLAAGMLLPNVSEAKNSMPVALSGRVWVYCDASRQPIKPGDLLTSAAVPGHAMKVINHTKAQGAIIGKAMTELKSGKGLVLVLVTLQ